MKVLFDTNILLDLLLNREPFVSVAARLIARVERHELIGVVCATTLTTIYYLLTKVANPKQAKEAIRTILQLFDIAPVDRTVLEHAEILGFKDYEDAVLHEAGRLFGANLIVTRNLADFTKSKLLVHSPLELEALLSLESTD